MVRLDPWRWPFRCGVASLDRFFLLSILNFLNSGSQWPQLSSLHNRYRLMSVLHPSRLLRTRCAAATRANLMTRPLALRSAYPTHPLPTSKTNAVRGMATSTPSPAPSNSNVQNPLPPPPSQGRFRISHLFLGLAGVGLFVTIYGLYVSLVFTFSPFPSPLWTLCTDMGSP